MNLFKLIDKKNRGGERMLGNENIVEIIIKKTLILALIIMGGIILIAVKEPKPYILGLIFGTLVGILTFLLMDKSVKRAAYLDPDSAYTYTVRQYFIRMSIYAIILIIAAIADYLSFLTTAIGLLLIKTTIIFLTIWDYISSKFK